jgi:hypothetical protein
MVDLERDILTFGFFETLESRHNDGAIQRCGKSPGKEALLECKAETRGENSSKGQKAKRGSTTVPGNTGYSANESPRCMIPTSQSDVSA